MQGNNVHVTLLYIVDNVQRFQQPVDEIIFLRGQALAPEYLYEF